MKIIVTGASGTVGRRLCRDLESHKHHVVRLGRRSSSATTTATTYQVEDLRRRLVGADAVVHLAWRRSPSDRIDDFFPSITATENLMAACAAEGVGRVVGASSISVYSGDRPWQESDSPRPATKYGLSKLMGEGLLELGTTSDLSSISLRLGHVYTDDEYNGYAVNTFIALAATGQPLVVTGDSDRRRDMVYVGDVSRAIQLALLAPEVPPRLNVGSGRPVSSAEIATAAAKAFGRGSHVVLRDQPEGGAGSTHMCTQFASESIGYVPASTLDDAMADIAARRRSRGQ